MDQTVNLPKLGDTADEVVVSQWMVAEGERVSAGDVVLVVETNKASVDVESPFSGVLVRCLVSPDEEIATGTPIFIVSTS